MKATRIFRLQTSRLYLREMTDQDAEHAYLLNLDPEVLKYTGDVAFESTEVAREFLNKYDQYERFGVGRWAVIRKEDEMYLGWCGLKFHPVEQEYDLGFRLFKQYWRRGYASEAAFACLKWAFETVGIERIVANVDEENIASIKTIEKLKMRQLPQQGRTQKELKFSIDKETYWKSF